MDQKGAGAGDDAARVAGSMCDRLLMFLAKNLSMTRQKSIAEGPRNGGGGQVEGGAEEEDDEFAIRIERAEFDDLEFGGHGEGGHGGGTTATILEDASAAAATARERDGDGRPVPAAAAAVGETTKVRKTVTIKEERPGEDGGGGGDAAPAVERKMSLFKRRQASSSSLGGGGDHEPGGRAPRRSGLRPRLPPVLSNINERSSTFIEERKRGFGGGGGKPAPAK